MKKFFIVLIAVAVLVITISLSVIAASVFSNRRGEQKTESQNTVSSSDRQPIAEVSSSQEESALDYLYLVKQYNGNIGVFNAGEDTPFKVIETDVSLLPSFDRIALEDGIEIYTEGELDSIIEDFDS